MVGSKFTIYFRVATQLAMQANEPAILVAMAAPSSPTKRASDDAEPSAGGDIKRCFISVPVHYIEFPDLKDEIDVVPPANPPVPLRCVRYLDDLPGVEWGKFANKQVQFSVQEHACPFQQLAKLYSADLLDRLRWDIATSKRADGTFDVTYLVWHRDSAQNEYKVTQFSLQCEPIHMWNVPYEEAEIGIEALRLLPPRDGDTSPVLAVIFERENDLCASFWANPPRPAERTPLLPLAAFVPYRNGLVCYWPCLLKRLCYIDEQGSTDLFSFCYCAPKKIFIANDDLIAADDLNPRDDSEVGRGKRLGISDSGALHIFSSQEFKHDDPTILEREWAFGHMTRPTESCFTATSPLASQDSVPALCIKRAADYTEHQHPRIIAASDQGFVLTEDWGCDDSRFVTIVNFTGVTDLPQ